ncbi:alpha-amylase family glycosyl hydrolase [uncultured Muribaculum sp.]|jgi:alpha-amylase|uniref:alpha-amylase family glycosyl hydrolase n=1 Tax=uncultured Muribaculum sp. TaxID=1918613 RepID=UPI0025B1D529|nr:alpha-amylase family glycosyl hydrolase [uncultured Muribaculum sp.]
MRHSFFSLAVASAVAVCAFASCNGKEQQALVQTDDDAILHAWSWSFDTIAANMKNIADAGFAYVQTSPVNTCFVGEDGGMALFSEDGDSVKGKWYYYYQPVDWQIGNYLLGSERQFKSMMDSAARYGVKVIVDVLPNHVAVDRSAVTARMDSAVGGADKLLHSKGMEPITDYNDRFQCTNMAMGGLPDVNTENPAFQKYYMDFVNRLLAYGVSGFRYDTAKHIALPSDPLDSLSERNNFWDVALGREAVDGVKLAVPADSLFVYGEVLQDKNVKEEEYAGYMKLTASNYGHALRHVLEEQDYYADSLGSWHHPSPGTKLVTWVESHDTYANAHESAHISDAAIRQGYVFLTARSEGTPLFFSRPAGSTRQNYWGNNLVGARGNDEFMHPEVVAVNKFRRRMHGQPEIVRAGDSGRVVVVERGTKGAVLINLSDGEQTVSLPSALPDGNYVDKVHNSSFTVNNGELSGKLAPFASYIITGRGVAI